MAGHPVYIHGRGLVSALGANVPAALECLASGGVEPSRLEVSPGLAWPYFAIDADTTDWYVRARRLITAAVEQCGPVDRDAPLFLASCSLNIGAIEDGLDDMVDCQNFADTVGQWLAWRGPVFWISTACTSASNALFTASAQIRAGRIPAALVLGFELRNRFSCAGFGAMQLLDSQRPRPLAEDRAGLVLGEAVAALWLDHRPGRWRVCGGANVVDGRDPAGATPEAITLMTRHALADAGLEFSQIDLIKLQAAGSRTTDATELAALRPLGQKPPALVSFKAELGHTLGASGAAELVVLLACLEHGVWPRPRTPVDPALAVTLSDSPPEATRYLMNTILGFGGGHSTLIVERLP